MVLLAVNAVGYDSGLLSMAALGDLPLLQDTVAEDAWTSWMVTYRDVVILDEENRQVGVYNLTQHDLNDPASYAALKAMLVAEVED